VIWIAKFSTTFNTHTQPFNGALFGATLVGQYQKGKTNLDFTEAGDSEWQWHQLGHMQVCTSLQADNHASTPPLSFLQAGCPSCLPTNSVKAPHKVTDFLCAVVLLVVNHQTPCFELPHFSESASEVGISATCILFNTV